MMLSCFFMRTTVTIDDTVEKRLRRYAGRNSLRFKQALNEILRKGLNQVEGQPKTKNYRTKAKKVGLKAGLSYDNVAELLEQVEGPQYK